MSFPLTSTPSPGIHTDPTTAGASGALQLPNLIQALAQLPEEIVQDILNVLVSVFTGVETVIDATVEDVDAAIGAFISTTTAAVDSVVTTTAGLVVTTENLAGEIETAVANAIVTAINGISGIVGGAFTIGEDALAFIANIFTSLFGLLGNPSMGTGAGSAATVATPTLQDLLGLLGSNTQVPANLLKALTPGATKNVLTDPGFDTGNSIQGEGLWCWDGWVGTGDFNGPMGSIRTVRPGRITIYNVVGTSQGVYFFGGEPVGVGGSGIILEYLRDPDLTFLVGWALTGTDPTFFEWINVPYPAAEYPMGGSVLYGATWLANQIKQTPGPYIIIGDSQGCQVAAAVYDQIRYGSLQDRRSDLLAVLAYGNLRREQGHTFPGYPDPAPGTSGMCVVPLTNAGPYAGAGNPANPAVGNLIDTEDLWWDFCVAGDYYACCPVNGVTVVPDPDAVGGNVGDIPGIPGFSLRQLYAFINQAYTGGNNIITDVINWTFAYGLLADIALLEEFLGSVMQQINNLGGVDSPHNSYHVAQPFLDQGDDRTFFDIGLDYIRSFTNRITPPLDGVRHQLCGQRVAVQEFQVVTAGAQAMWINVEAVGPAIMVCVNAYDAQGNLIATVTADEATVSDPEPTTNWAWETLQADFVMPPGSASACIVFDVEPQAMSTGIVWFDDAVFEVSNLIDSALLGNISNIPQLSATSVAGPQGIADMLTAIQNIIDHLASANNGTLLTGVQLADLFQSQAQVALTASSSYDLGVVNHQILSSPITQEAYNGLEPSGESTFKLTDFTPGGSLPTQSVSAGNTIAGLINCAQSVTKGFIEFLAYFSGGTGVYVNVYQVDTTTGTWTNLWSSADISTSLGSGSPGWVAINIATADQISVTAGEWIALEIVADGTSINVAAETWAIPTKSSATIASNIGATRATSSTGGVSPSTLTSSQLTFNGTVPYILFGISDLPPNFEPPDQQSFATAGITTYSIPDWLVSGDLIDLAGVGGGGAGGPYSSSKAGQGGEGGSWNARTITYGTDISTSITDLDVIVGMGGFAGGSGYGYGGDTIVGHGLLTPTFDAEGTGITAANISSGTFTHTATAGAYVLLAMSYIAPGAILNRPTYGGVNFEIVGVMGSIKSDGTEGAITVLYAFPDAPGVATLVEISTATGTFGYVTANTFSYENVSGAAAVFQAAGIGSPLTQTASCSAGQLIVQAFSTGNQAAILSAFTGGTERYFAEFTGNYSGLVVSEYLGGTGTTFGASIDNVNSYWSSLAVVLNPGLGTVLLDATGGVGGGSGSGFHLENPNSTSTGLSPGNESFAGRTYYGGPATTTTHLPGNAPGGGSAGGDASFPPEAAAPGAVWITARQP